MIHGNLKLNASSIFGIACAILFMSHSILSILGV